MTARRSSSGHAPTVRLESRAMRMRAPPELDVLLSAADAVAIASPASGEVVSAAPEPSESATVPAAADSVPESGAVASAVLTASESVPESDVDAPANLAAAATTDGSDADASQAPTVADGDGADEEYYDVETINNVRTRGGVRQYRVVWKVSGKQKEGTKLPHTWEDEEKLVADGCDRLLERVDMWALDQRAQQSHIPFDQWQATSFPVRTGANEQGTCLFDALRSALERLNQPLDLFEKEMDRFTHHPLYLAQDHSGGLKWSQFRAFVQQYNSAGGKISWSAFDYNFQRTGLCGIAAIKRMKLPVGVYIVACTSKHKVGHAVAMQITRAGGSLFDKGERSALTKGGVWFNRVQHVHKIVIEE